MLKKYRILLTVMVIVILFVIVYVHEKKSILSMEQTQTTNLQYLLTVAPNRREGYSTDSYKVVHLDMKGAPPKLSYLKKLLPLLAKYGCDCLLIEYEDMFPYTGIIANISAKNAYTKKEVRQLLTWAHDLGIQVIPLVQTFGHLEHALKLPEWAHLRELPPYPQELCPLNPSSIMLIQEMISQVMSMHRGSRYIHLGGDEVYHLGVCPRCVASYINGWSLYTNHMEKVALWVIEKYGGVQPIIWDDMMRSWSPNFLKDNPLIKLVQPMVWVYSRDVNTVLHHRTWYWYEKLFKKIWVAGVFKGASLPTSVFPDIRATFENQRSWISLMSNTQNDIVGFVLTGWSRHDHFAVLCETLPSAIPSLFLNLISMQQTTKRTDTEQLLSKWAESLSCSEQPSSFNDVKQNPKFLLTCEFPGIDAYLALLKYKEMKARVEFIETTIRKSQGWMTRYNLINNFTSPWRVIDEYTKLNVFAILKNLTNFKNETSVILNQYFDRYSTKEWIDQKIVPLQDILWNLTREVDSLIIRNIWPRRPLS